MNLNNTGTMEFFTRTHVAFFIIIAAGIALGKIRIRGISLDISAVIFVALIFGHLGVKMPVILQKLGLILFMFSVGIQAGPGFFESFRKTGKVLIGLSVLVITSGALVTILMAWIWEIDFKMAVGLFTGALTSTSGLAAAIESTESSLSSIGFGIAYPFGVIGVILFVRLSPRLFRVDLKQEEQKFEAEVQTHHPDVSQEIRFDHVFGCGRNQCRRSSGRNATSRRPAEFYCWDIYYPDSHDTEHYAGILCF